MGLLLNGFLARLLGPAHLGAYYLIVSIVSGAALIARLGLDRAAHRLIPEHGGTGRAGAVPSIVRRIAVYGLLSSLLVAGVLAGGLWEVIGNRVFRSEIVAGVSIYAAILTIPFTLEALFAEAIRGFHEIGKATLLNKTLTRLIAAIVFGNLFFFVGSSNLQTVLLIFIIVSMGSVIVAGTILWNRASNISRVHEPAEEIPSVTTVQMFSISIPLFLIAALLFINSNIGLWILGAFSGEAQVALFGAAFRVMVLISIPLWLFNQVLPPTISELYAQKRVEDLERTLRSSATLAAIPSLVLFLCIVFFGNQIMSIIFGPDFSSGGRVLAFLAAGQLFGVWAGSNQETLMMTGNERIQLLGTVASVGLTMLLSLALVQDLGAEGVAIAFSSGIVLVNVLMLGVARMRLGIWTHSTGLRKALAFWWE